MPTTTDVETLLRSADLRVTRPRVAVLDGVERDLIILGRRVVD